MINSMMSAGRSNVQRKKIGFQINDTNDFQVLLAGASTDKAILPCDSGGKIDLWYKTYNRNVTNVRKDFGGKQRIIDELDYAVRKLSHSSYICVPDFVQKYVDHAQQDPSRNSTNSLCHGGGSLQSLYLNERPLLLYVAGKCRDTLCSAFMDPAHNWNLELKSSENTFPFLAEIFQVLHYDHCENVLVGIRQKFNCSLYKLQEEDGSISLEKLFAAESGIPFSSFAVCPETNLICTTDFQKTIKIWDIFGRKLQIAENSGPENLNHDGWSSVLFSTEHQSVLYFADRISFHLYDVRSGVHLEELFDLQKGESANEEIYHCFQSELDSLHFYIATSDRLLLVDTRFPHRAMQVWLHSMTSPPLYSSVVPLGQYKKSEMVCIGNLSGDVCLASADDSKSSVMKIPSLIDSLSTSQSRGLVDKAFLKYRILHDIVGLTCVKEAPSNNFKIFLQNAVSDIFSQSIHIGEEIKDFNTQNICKFPSCSGDEEGTSRWNLKHLQNCLTAHWQPLDSGEELEIQNWNVPEINITSYKDALAGVIAESWGYDEVSPREQTKVLTKEKVMDWLVSVNSEVPPSDSDIEETNRKKIRKKNKKKYLIL